MSGTRANASARTRRAGGADINSSGPGPMQRGPPGQQQMQQHAQPKLSISDAIGLITLRLGRMEQIVQTIQTNPNDPTSISEGDENSVLVDKQVFDNIVKRLDTIEQKQKTIVTAPLAAAANTPTLSMQNLVTIQKHDTFVKDIAKELKEMKELINKPCTLTNEIAEMKEMLLKLQTFTMETNSKLVNVIFSDSPQFEFLEENQEEDQGIVDSNEIIMDDFNMKFFGSIPQPPENANICELVIEENV